KRPNLRVETEALTARILFEGKRAVGVEFIQGGKRKIARARIEVILAAGSVASPQLLELSGVGNPDILAANGVPLVHALPGVGENLQDHYMIGMQWRLKKEHVTVNERAHGLRLAKEIARYAFSRKGLLSFAVAHIVAFAKSRPDLAHPDLQLHLMPASVDLKKLGETQAFTLETEPGMTITPCQLRPESRGHIHIKSNDPMTYPSIFANYLGDPIDRQAAIDGLKLARRVAQAPVMEKYVAYEDFPGKDVQTDEQIAAYCSVAGTTLYHPVGTCKMGHDPMAVVDPQLRVHGLEGLRVVDASIMPRIVSGNTNAPTIMIGERGADLILEDAKRMRAAA
ncbi:MAG: Choline dehydrogenase, partial [Sphingomonas bacterium]|nr:Choline dehydrogenase [Sphingomonas bacterium]